MWLPVFGGSTMRVVSAAGLGAVAGFALYGCFTPQPLPECDVRSVGPYAVALRRTDAPNACATSLAEMDVDGGRYALMQMGMQRFQKAGEAESTVGYRSSVITTLASGELFTAFVDPGNDCALADDLGCDLCVVEDPLRADDGGLFAPHVSATPDCTADSTCVLDCGDGTFAVDDGSGGCNPDAPVDPANTCQAVEDIVPRVDPSDPEAKNAVGRANLTRYPTNGLCTLDGFSAGAQSFQEETLPVNGFGLDAGTVTFPALEVRLDWANFRVVNNARVQYSAWKAELTLTEGSCVAHYDAQALWPLVECASDADCDPLADPDAGRFYGSNIAPDLKPRCNLALGVCEPGVDAEALK